MIPLALLLLAGGGLYWATRKREIAIPPPASHPPSQAWRVIVAIDLRVSGIEQTLGGINRSYISSHLAPIVRDMTHEIFAAHLGFPSATYRFEVYNIDSGFRVIITYDVRGSLELPRIPVLRAGWQEWLAARLQRTRYGNRIAALSVQVPQPTRAIAA